MNNEQLKMFMTAVGINYISMMFLSVLVSYEYLNDWIAKAIIIMMVTISVCWIMSKRQENKPLNIAESIR